MTAMRPVLEFIIDANIVVLLAFCLWRVVQTVLLRSHMRNNFTVQLRLLKSALAVTFVSPFLAFGAVSAIRALWPDVPMTVGDIAVAAYLRGEITLPALEFEALLNSRTSERLDSEGSSGS